MTLAGGSSARAQVFGTILLFVRISDFTIVFRVLAAIGAAMMIMFSLVALARIDWSSEWMDAAPVQVADVTFTPIVAIAFGVAGCSPFSPRPAETGRPKS